MKCWAPVLEQLQQGVHRSPRSPCLRPPPERKRTFSALDVGVVTLAQVYARVRQVSRALEREGTVEPRRLRLTRARVLSGKRPVPLPRHVLATARVQEHPLSYAHVMQGGQALAVPTACALTVALGLMHRRRPMMPMQMVLSVRTWDTVTGAPECVCAAMGLQGQRASTWSAQGGQLVPNRAVVMGVASICRPSRRTTVLTGKLSLVPRTAWIPMIIYSGMAEVFMGAYVSLATRGMTAASASVRRAMTQ